MTERNGLGLKISNLKAKKRKMRVELIEILAGKSKKKNHMGREDNRAAKFVK